MFVVVFKSIYGWCKVFGLEVMDRVFEGDEFVLSCFSVESLV